VHENSSLSYEGSSVAPHGNGQSSVLERLSTTLVPELRRYLTQHRAGVEDMIRGASLEAGLPAGQRYTKIYDGMLSALFVAAQTAMQRTGNWVPVSLAAVGSYGRASLSPFSDLDVRLLCDGDTTNAAPAAEALLYPLWDAGINIGHQVVTANEVIELARNDLPTATTLLDWRRIAGDSELSVRLLERAFQGVFEPGNIGAFVDLLETRTRERHERFGGSVFLLEPDVRNGEGGLRDLDIAHWAARARWRVSDLQELVRIGILVAREWTEIDEARGLLLRIRNLLHLGSGRGADRFSFDQQERLANKLGYGQGGAAVERFMSDYYRRARAVARAREMLLSRARPPPRRRPRQQLIGGGLKLQGDAVSIVNREALDENPALALMLYMEAVRRGLPVYDFARHLVARAASNPGFCEALRESPAAKQLFLELVCVVQHTRLKGASVLKELHDVGLLVAMIPEFTPVVGRVHHDIYHVYTVDAHSVAAVDQLRALCRGDLASEHPLACRLAAELARPRVLFLATLLHDIGKDLGGKDHSVRGAQLARRILERLGVADADIVEVQNHVLNHLRMYHVATRRDLDDLRTVSEFCSNVRGQEALRELYLLTIADITTTSPVSMTNWKRRMLDELFVLAERHCVGSSRLGPSSALRQQQVLDLWPAERDPAFIRHFLSGLPERYLHANEPAVVIEHALFAERAQARGSSLRAVSEQDPYLELWVVADDGPGLLAMITATFCRARLKVLSAEVYSWIGQDGRSRSLDIFWVKCPKGMSSALELLPSMERDLSCLLGGEADPVEMATGVSSRTRWSSRPTPPISTKVNLDNGSATNHTIVEVISRDRPALLFWLSTTIQQAGLSIWFAKINTEGERVADVFYVSDESGAKIVDSARLHDLEQRILSAVTRLESTFSSST
jgi:[protein-PII] uridylyltransferase